MVPSAFVFMDAVPLTPNGKIDRSKLPMPESSQRSKFVAPRTPVEQNIAEIWAKVLRVDRVGIDDNFFDLGGHSLLATQVISRMRGVFNYDIPLRSLFEAPTVEDLAMVIIRQQAEKVSNTEMERLLDDVEAVSGEMVRAATKRSQ
jgi:acyl carrier protein